MEIEVKSRKLNEEAERERNLRNSLYQIAESVQAGQGKLKASLSSSASSQIDCTLQAVCDSIQHTAQLMGSMSDTLSEAAHLYDSTEAAVSGQSVRRKM